MSHALVRTSRPVRRSSVSTGPAPPRPRRSVVLLVFILGVLSATSPLATDLYLPAFPQIADDLGASEAQVQLTLTAVMVGLALGQLVVGPLSDQFGRRVPLLIGTAVFAATSILCMFVTSAEMFTAIRFLQGLAAAAGMAVSRAVVRDAFDGDSAARFFSRLVLLVGLAPMLGPIIGGRMLLFGPWQVIFAALGVAGVVGFALVFFGLPETLPRADRRRQDPMLMLRTFGRLLRDPRFIAPALTMALSFAMTFTYISSFSFVSQAQFGASAQQFSLIFGITTLGMILGNQVNAALIGRMGTSQRLFAGLAGATLTVLLLVALDITGWADLVTVTAVLFAMMFCTGLISPNATTLAIASQPSTIAGSTSALLGTLQFALGGTLAAAAGFTSTGEATLTSMIVVMLATGLAATGVFAVAAVRGHAGSA
ncbi:Bcr/CflA family drug resistance efflux transporter [Nocardiopsis gilva YIM 90087]|uniref:Bcr/CflA family drug resistance efflux transporter n=1 Tax=Nocardiopsis gilva YIM 90087 TaxID=1235441 RepID=A0A223S5Z3_9ACTN|nr:multidrug effflux MFS transporter [Nocardiopsis gilva]ASU83525.1 Bcr/CflA family drug resistance efflux transporter [Nocardiopsis gilva YIM 90087]